MNEDPVDAAVMGLLAEHVPLSLLCDLGTSGEPDSAAIMAAEACPTEPWWEPPTAEEDPAR